MSQRRRISRPIPYEAFTQRVRRHRRDEVLAATARAACQLLRAEFDLDPPPAFPNVVQPFALAGVARAALLHGNNDQASGITTRDLVEMCDAHFNVAIPAFDREPGLERLRAVMAQFGYEQFGFQTNQKYGVGRTLALLEDHAATCAEAPTAGDWERALGVPLDGFMRIGFALHVAAMNTGGRFDWASLDAAQLTTMLTPFDPATSLEVIDRLFASTPSALGELGRASLRPGLEKWSFNPLVEAPVVKFPDGSFVVPSPQLLLDRITPTALYYLGIDTFGDRFPRALGCMFEAYVGSNLRLLQHTRVLPEITFDKGQKKTVDYFVITDECVVLVEVKAARPIWAARLGEPEGENDVVAKVNGAFKQIDASAAMVRDGHPAVSEIPSDRPMCGLVITLEPFHIVNSTLYDSVLTRPHTPSTVASATELEAVVATLATSPDAGGRLLAALTSSSRDAAPLTTATAGLSDAANPLIDDAWDRFTAPWDELIANLGSGNTDSNG